MAAVQAVVDAGESVGITVTGEVDGIPFIGIDTIRVIGLWLDVRCTLALVVGSRQDRQQGSR